MRAFIVGISGASGAVLARRTIQQLHQRGRRVVLVCSEAGQRVWEEELGVSLEDMVAQWAAEHGLKRYAIGDLGAPIASGTVPTAGMVVVPCSMGTVSAIAHGSSSNLLERAADVCLKEGRRLVLVPRETPLSVVHLENLLALARLGVRIVPPILAFYQQPRTVDDMVEAIVARVLDALGLPEALAPHQRYLGGEV